MKSGLSVKVTEGFDELFAQRLLLFIKVPPFRPAFAITEPKTFNETSAVVGQLLMPFTVKFPSAEYSPSISPTLELTVIFPDAENMAVDPTGTVIVELMFKFPLIRIMKFPVPKFPDPNAIGAFIVRPLLSVW